MDTVTFRVATEDDISAVGRLINESFAGSASRHGFASDLEYVHSPSSFLFLPFLVIFLLDFLLSNFFVVKH